MADFATDNPIGMTAESNLYTAEEVRGFHGKLIHSTSVERGQKKAQETEESGEGDP